MILCDHEIKEALKNGSLVIVPEPPPKAFDTSAVDLHLGNEFKMWKAQTPGASTVMDPQAPGFDFEGFSRAYTHRVPPETDGSIVIKNGDLILATTMESVHLIGFAARVEGKSTLARIGLAVHNTAPTIHFGFTGNITLELVNHGPYPLKLSPGQPICQLIIEQVYGTPDKKTRTGAFQGQTTVHGAGKTSSPPSS